MSFLDRDWSTEVHKLTYNAVADSPLQQKIVADSPLQQETTTVPVDPTQARLGYWEFKQLRHDIFPAGSARIILVCGRC